jgi:GWxTD domain-containing protein
VLLARGRVEREAGDLDSAAVAFQRYLAKGTDRALGLLEVARTELLRGNLEGAEPYYAGAAIDDSTAVAGYRADIGPIVSDSILREFDATHGQFRAAYLRAFWSQRDHQELRADGERLREHYRRLFYAKKNFALVGLNRHYQIEERYRSGSRDFDDRGIIYIRHGEPTDRASYQAPGIEPNESWRYARADGDLVFHFIAREDVQDYKLVESIFDVLGFSASVRLQERGIARNDTAQQLLISRERLSPIYRRLEGAGEGAGLSQAQAEERQLGHESIAIGTTTDSYELRFPKDLKVRSEVLAVGGDGQEHQLQIAYAIAGAGLEPVMVSRGYLYSVRLRFSAMDASGHVVATVDTTRRFVSPAPVPEHEHLVGRVAVTVPTGRLEYRLSIQQGEDAGVVLPTDTVRVGLGNRTSVALSDLVLGSRGTNLTWKQSDQDTVFFNPLRTYRHDDLMELYYEVGGLEPNSNYTTQLEVKRRGGGGGFLRSIFGGGGKALSLKFTEQAPTPIVRVRRSVQLDRLKPGEYVLQVIVTDAAGHSDRREQPFDVVDK